MALSSKQRRYVETVLAGLPHLAEAVAAIPPDWQPAAFQAAERSFLKAFRQLELSGPQTWASSVMRRLHRRVREAEKEKLTKLYEQLSANEHRSGPPMRQAYRYDAHQTASSGEQKNVGHAALAEERGSVRTELSAEEHIGQAPSSITRDAAISEKQQNVGRELSADEHIGQARSFTTHDAALPEEQENMRTELSAEEQISEAPRFTTDDAAAALSEKHVEGELSPDGEALSFTAYEVASSEEQKNVARESVKKDAIARRTSCIMIKVDEIFGDGRDR
jgi:hypothetical protein